MKQVDITLITAVPSAQTINGIQNATEYTLILLADKLSVGRTEFYEALKVGIQPTCIYKIFSYDFESANKISGGIIYEPEYIEEDGIRYKIVRTYQKTSDWVEATCVKVM
ncbi:MAG: hypothetical protein ACYCWE_20935 [Eubacteriales bacterium]